LPVSIHSFDSRFENGDLVVDWGTVSETRNAGFALWGDRGDGPELLTSSLIAGGDGDPLEPRQYSHRIAGVAPGEYERLFVTAVDVNGKERLYGDFEPGFAYGKPVAPAPIRWDRLRAEARSRMAELNQRSSTGGSATPATAVDVTAAHTGMIEVSHEQLTSAGLDLSDVPASRIAVTLKGEPVSRHVTGAIEGTDGQPLFGPGASVRFWADAPEIPDALYVDHYSFRIADDPANALPAASLVGEFTGFVDSFEPPPPPGSSVVGSYTARQTRDDDLAYNFASPLADPWYTARLRAGRNDTHIATFDLDSAAIPDQPATLRVRVGGLTDFPEAPDHRVVVELNGQTLGEKIFEGQTVVDLDLDVPAGLLQPGANSVRVVAPGGTQAPADIQLLDRIDLLHTRRLEAVDGRVLIERRLPAPGKRLVASGFGSGPAVAYARHDGQLIALETEREAAGKVAVLSLEQPADYWLSSVTAIHSPSNVRGVPDADLLAGNPDSDFIVIAHPAFMPFSMDESHPLNDFIAARQAEGWNTGLFDISAIQQQYGWGMPLPEAVNRFLAAADESLAFEHVLLVGGDSYDYTDNLGFGSISFIPTHYRAAKYIPHAPADPLLADLDGDGRPDKALGRWPVRSLDDLDSIVTKTLDWAGDPGELANAVWVTDSQDPNQASFVDQAAELSDALVGSGWPGAAIAGVHFDDIVPPAGVSTADAARAEYFTQLEQGRSLSGFVGHGSPAMWTFQGLLTPDDIGDLYNEGFPTLIGTMTCYTTYFVSPTSDTVAHRWMNGYREDALGDPIPGVANGSVAVHGAGVLSSYDNNGWFARTVLQHQLNGETLGRAIELTRAAVPAGGDALFNWILLGDPTLRLD
ncbi:MAG TPA: C25 family cysteine peptidase, partial [Wenzhouxiangellaceae bacterium]|nr:C25 family cysteine peptidase [Wenzhouxiangellaceae bacterium]